MTDCGVCLGYDDCDTDWEFQSEVIRTARKAHRCYECRRIIAKGTKYHIFSGKCEGDMCEYKTCMDCQNIRSGLSCNGAWPAFGDLWDEVAQSFKDLVSTACLTKIPTASAKAYFLERWRKYKGLDDVN